MHQVSVVPHTHHIHTQREITLSHSQNSVLIQTERKISPHKPTVALPVQELEKESKLRLSRCPVPMVLQVPSSSEELGTNKEAADSSSSDESEEPAQPKAVEKDESEEPAELKAGEKDESEHEEHKAVEKDEPEDDIPAEQDTEAPIADTQKDAELEEGGVSDFDLDKELEALTQDDKAVDSDKADRDSQADNPEEQLQNDDDDDDDEKEPLQGDHGAGVEQLDNDEDFREENPHNQILST